jgi:hypothetical protein
LMVCVELLIMETLDRFPDYCTSKPFATVALLVALLVKEIRSKTAQRQDDGLT